MLPITSEQFLTVFVNYNNAIWPIQIAAYLLGGISIALLFQRPPGADRIIASILAVIWLWTGIGYHGLSFSVINKAVALRNLVRYRGIADSASRPPADLWVHGLALSDPFPKPAGDRVG
jgi:uncharacterized protein DUF6064